MTILEVSREKGSWINLNGNGKKIKTKMLGFVHLYAKVLRRKILPQKVRLPKRRIKDGDWSIIASGTRAIVPCKRA